MIENQTKTSPRVGKPYNISIISIGILAVFILAVKLFLASALPNKQKLHALDLSNESILNAVNQQRSLRNLVTLNTNSKLNGAAQYKANDMQSRHYFAHIDPDGHYIWDKIVAEGYYPYTQLGENLAIEFYDTESLVSAWMNSPTHRANLLNESFRDQGMGLSLGTPSQGQYYSAVANTFGTLANSSAPKAAPTPTLTTKPKPKPSPKPTPTPKTLGNNTPTPTPTPVQTPSFVPTASPTPILEPTHTPTPTYVSFEIRRSPASENSQENFKTPSHEQTTTTPVSDSGKSTPGVVGTQKNLDVTDYDVNRYLILFCGIILLILALSDIKKSVEEKLSHLDKKVNNLVILIISIIVIAFMYWL